MGTKQDFSGLKVGDGIWCTQPNWRSSEPENDLLQLVVVKVGRKYLTTKEADSKYHIEQVFNIETGIEKGDGNYLKKLVLSPYQYMADRKRNAAWKEFHRAVQNMYSNYEVEEADIRAAAKLLNIELT